MLTMYYDSDCPICRTEAHHLQHKCPERLTIVAVDDAIELLAQAGISRTDAMTYLCVQDAQGKLHTHMDAVRLLYASTAKTPSEVRFARALHLPIIKQVGDWLYPIFARNRYYFPDWFTRLIFGKVVDDKAIDDKAVLDQTVSHKTMTESKPSVVSPSCANGICHIPPSKRNNKAEVT